ncbi:MAG TPA: hypothetical protein PLW97_02165 [Synergistaceae bacterium]|nr:hypothetical protein [Synergistaceae bacterium]HPQ36435.1 hypothetical protein [Synergistaceae bacterium]
MFMGLFGEFLLQKGYITAEQLRLAYGSVENARPKLGTLAINEGYMTSDQVETVHSMQVHEDRRFGDIATEMGYLSVEQLEALLSMQRRPHAVLAQALMDRKVLSMKDFNNAVEEYKREYGLRGDVFDALTEDDIDVTVRFCLQGKRILEHDLLMDYVSLFARSMVRFVDRFVVLCPAFPEEDDLASEYLALQLVTQRDKSSMLTAISGDVLSLAALGRAFSGEDITALDALGKAATEEFLNLVNGLFAVNMSDFGKNFTMHPPLGVPASVLEGMEKDLFAVLFRFGDFSMKLFVMDGVPKILEDRLLRDAQDCRS